MMHRIDSTNAVDGLFIAGNPVTGTRPTAHTAEHDNAIQLEICNVITAGGFNLDKNQNDQLLIAIQTHIDQRVASAIDAATPGIIAAAIEKIVIAGSSSGSGTATCEQLSNLLIQYASVDPVSGLISMSCPDVTQPTFPTGSSASVDAISGNLTLTIEGESSITGGILTLTDTATESYIYTNPDLEITNA